MNQEQHLLKLPEYGNMIQQLIDKALKMPNKADRTRMAHVIVSVMKVIDANSDDSAAYRKYSADYNAKLWDHLAYLSNYQLDIDYPTKITQVKEENITRQKLPYPQKNIKYRHYGALLQQLLEITRDVKNKEAQKKLIKAAGNRMKRNLADWKGDGITNDKVAQDIAEYTEGEITPKFKANELIKIDINHKTKTLTF
ncbi:MAG: DUF4290 domain-containing protein [Bacteroidaceae bacterium]|jgi:hypothetical protein|nr:DUF4290 domain-containing protein [Bacteroidaceae bacterium]